MGSLIARDVSGSDFDSTLYTADVDEHHNADLVLKVRTKIENYELRPAPGGGPGLVAYDSHETEFPAVELNQAQLNAKWATVKQKAEYVWNGPTGQGQLWLVPDPPRDFHYVDSSVRTRVICPYIRCVLRILPCLAGDTPHLTIEVVERVTPHPQFISSAGGGRMTLDDEDFEDDNPYTIPHEIGHHLGLSHVHRYTFACGWRLTGNSGVCYGEDGSWPNNNIMGGGRDEGAGALRVEAWNSWPWRNRMNQHWDIGHDWTHELRPPHTLDHHHAPAGRPRPRGVRWDTRDNDPVAGVRDRDGGV